MTADIEGNLEDVALPNAATKRMRVTSDSCWLAATARQRLKARERSRWTNLVCQCEPELVQERGWLSFIVSTPRARTASRGKEDNKNKNKQTSATQSKSACFICQRKEFSTLTMAQSSRGAHEEPSVGRSRRPKQKMQPRQAAPPDSLTVCCVWRQGPTEASLWEESWRNWQRGSKGPQGLL